ncbi:MAG: DUF5107 domain-containing protein [Planctomycetota bacterium]|jgi:hypothetical protein
MIFRLGRQLSSVQPLKYKGLMGVQIKKIAIDNKPVVRLENDFLRIDIAPAIGGRIVSIIDKKTSYEFLWRNPNLELKPLPAGSPYDPNFYGGIDEVIPCDIPEKIDGIDYPDHGELWTTPLEFTIGDNSLLLAGTLPLSNLNYQRKITLRPDSPYIDTDYKIENRSDSVRYFLWKMHAALNVQPDDLIDCPAQKVIVADPQWSKWKTTEPFSWPNVEGSRADIIPSVDNTMDFLFLYDLQTGRLGWKSNAKNLKFEYLFDTKVFPYVCYFASYGGFDGHWFAIIEPCTAMPLMVNDAIKQNQCSCLPTGQTLKTRITTYAGPVNSDT